MEEYDGKWLRAKVNNIAIYDDQGISYVNMPVYSDIVDWKQFIDSVDAPYLKAYVDMKGIGDSLVSLKAFAYVAQVMDSYYQFEVGHPYYIRGIHKIDGDPSLGRVLHFHVTENCHLYYVPAHRAVKSQVMADRLKKMPKFDSLWHYCIGKDCPQ